MGELLPQLYLHDHALGDFELALDFRIVWRDLEAPTGLGGEQKIALAEIEPGQEFLRQDDPEGTADPANLHFGMAAHGGPPRADEL